MSEQLTPQELAEAVHDELTPAQRKEMADQLVKSLAAAAPVEKRMTLFDLAQEVAALSDSEGAVPDELLAEFRTTVQSTLLAKGEKVDSYARLIHYHMKRSAEAKGALAVEQETEVDRLKRRMKREEGAADRLGSMALWVISQEPRDSKGKFAVLEGINYTLAAANVADSCEVTDESLVPLEFKDVTISREMPATEWQAMLATVGMIVEKKEVVKVKYTDFKAEYSVDKKRLLAALKEPCAACNDEGAINTNPPWGGVETKTCSKCNGSGKRLVPGAKLLTGKMRLIVK